MYTILQIDENQKLKNALHSECSKKGFTYLFAESINTAKEMFEKKEIDILLLSGETQELKSFIKWVNEKNKNMLIFLITSDTEYFGTKGNMYEFGITDYIKEGATAAEILAHLQSVLDKEGDTLNLLTKLNIAVIDDSPLMIEMVKDMLESNYIKNVDYFSTGNDIINAPKMYDLYLTDMMLGDTTGKEVIENLREKNKDALIIVISSLDDYNTIANVLSSGADDYLIKPFDDGILMARLKANMRIHLLRMENERLKQAATTLKEKDHNEIYFHQCAYELIEREAKKAKQFGKELAVGLFDLDKLRDINKKMGFKAGDTVLNSVARIIKKNLADFEILSRYKGYQFLALFPLSSLDKALEKVKKVLQQVSSLKWKNQDFSISLSAALVSLKDQTPYSLLENCENLLKEAKEKGTNQILAK